ncbi:STAS domain-containing protein [bacterium]|nr:STAS domain-containing protein [bacterium]
MKFNIKMREGIAIIVLEGDMVGGPDAALLSEKFRELIEAGSNRILLDMKHVDYMNSSGLGILIAGVTTVRNNGGELKLLHLIEKLRNLLRITKLHQVFEIYENEDEAIASFT